MDNPLELNAGNNCFAFAVKFIRRDGAPQDVIRIQEALEAFLDETRVDDHEKYALALAVEELVLNVANHSALPDDAPSPLECRGRVDVAPDAVRLEMDDNGQPFDPNHSPRPPLDDDPLERPIGGLGLHMLKQLFGGPDYRREQNRNKTVWTMTRGEK